jgi:hypothetical protein
MPLIEIQSLPNPHVDGSSICRSINAAVATAIPCRIEGVWTTWRTIDGPIAMGGVVSTDDTAAAFGPIVHVYHHRSPDQVERAVDAIATVLARELSVDRDRIFVTTQPVAIDDPTLRRGSD